MYQADGSRNGSVRVGDTGMDGDNAIGDNGNAGLSGGDGDMEGTMLLEL
jgi:hypothetical protein